MAKKDTPTLPPAGHSDPSTAKAARLLEIAAKVRQVPGSFQEGTPDLYHRWWIVAGRLIKEAYDLGAWRWEGSQIGDKLKSVFLPGRDRQEWLAGEMVPVWLGEARDAVVDTLTDHLIPLATEKQQVEFEARIVAEEIEREANRKDAEGRAGPAMVGLDDEEEKILRKMAQQPNHLFVIVEFSGSNKTVGQRLNQMIAAGLACRPRGKNGGAQITDHGMSVARQANLVQKK